MKSNSQRAIEAAQATNVAICTYPGYPDPTTHTGWADIPAVLLGVDLTGREDIEYTAMIGESILRVDNGTLAVAEPVDGERIWLMGLQFDNDLPDLDIVGIADDETVEMFAEAELIVITTEARMERADGKVAVLILAANDRSRWTSPK